ncbi:MAG: capsular biosynthesis protein [Clostridium sp.]|nr:capsular biosynthesis protein [Clostridium sp.]
MIDIHSHILSGIDDGSQSKEMTLEMLRQAAKDGTEKIVATPHFCRGYGESTYEEVKELVKDIRNLAKEEEINIDIYHGQEVYYSESMLNDYNEGIIGTINDSKYMLFEFPMTVEPDEDAFNIIYELQLKGLVLILAHPERYKFVINNPEKINRFIDEGVLFQLNSGSLEGKFGDKVKKTANILVENGIYNFIGSDAHNDGSRKTGVSNGAMLAAKKNGIYESLFWESAERVLMNQDIEFVGLKVKKRKSFFSFLKK